MSALITNQCPRCGRGGSCRCRTTSNKRKARNAGTMTKSVGELADFFGVDIDVASDPAGFLKAVESALSSALRTLHDPAREEPDVEDVLGTESTAVAGNRRRLSAADISLGLRSLASEADRHQRQYVANVAADAEDIADMIPPGYRRETDDFETLAGNSGGGFNEDDEVEAMRPKRFDPRTGKYVFC